MGARIRRKIAAGKDAKEIKKLHLMINRMASYVDEHVNNTVVMFRTVIEATDTEQEVKDILDRSIEKKKAMEAAGGVPQPTVPQPTDDKEEAK